eukprot:g2751.t1
MVGGGNVSKGSMNTQGEGDIGWLGGIFRGTAAAVRSSLPAIKSSVRAVGSARPLAFASEGGVAAKSIIPRPVYYGLWGLSGAAVFADIATKTMDAPDHLRVQTAGYHTLFHIPASLVLPAVIIHKVVHVAEDSVKTVPRLSQLPPRVKSVIPVGAALLSIIPVVPVVDHVCEMVMEPTLGKLLGLHFSHHGHEDQSGENVAAETKKKKELTNSPPAAFFAAHSYRRIVRIIIMPKRTLRIGILNCPGSYDYGKIFEAMLKRAARDDRLEIRTRIFQAHKGELPPDKDEEADSTFDGFMITGSSSSAYDSDPWIRDLLKWTKESIRTANARIVGICFGHQIVAEALLPGSVKCNPRGWEVGVTRFCTRSATFKSTVVDRLRERIKRSADMLTYRADGTSTSMKKKKTETDFETMTLMCAHGDIVCTLPPGYSNLGYNKNSDIQGMLSDSGRVLTFQSHPEFSRDVASGVAKGIDTRVGPLAELTRGGPALSAVLTDISKHNQYALLFGARSECFGLVVALFQREPIEFVQVSLK